MKFKTTLIQAIRGTEAACVDGYEVERLRVPDLPDTVCVLEFVDEHGYGFDVLAVDQPIEFDDEGKAVFNDTDGREHGVEIDVNAFVPVDTFNLELGTADMSVGLAGDEQNAGTWEWFDRSTKEFSGGFGTAQEAYVSAARHALEEKGIELKTLDEDGVFIGA